MYAIFLSEAEKVAEVAAIQYDRMIMEKKKQKEMSDVENQANEARVKSQADAEFYQVEKQAQANKVHTMKSVIFGGECGCVT